jgi:anthranilate 1,2-dioxygenase small subunit/terephthalate 1,2-dioxygenase oxygenase component beta subunit
VTLDTDGGLKLAQRIVVCDSDSFDTLLAIPF